MSLVVGMPTKKVTVTLDAEQLEQIRQLVASAHAASVSGFVQHAVAGQPVVTSDLGDLSRLDPQLVMVQL